MTAIRFGRHDAFIRIVADLSAPPGAVAEEASPTRYQARPSGLEPTTRDVSIPSWAGIISSVRVEAAGEVGQLIVETQTPATFKSFPLTPDEDGGHRLVVDVHASAAAPAPMGASPAGPTPDEAARTARREISLALAEGDAARACALIEERFPAGSWDLEAMFLEAQCRTELGQIEEARAVYQRMLAFDPSLERVQLELDALPVPGAPVDEPEKTREASTPQGLSALARPASLAARTGDSAALWTLAGAVNAVYESVIELGPANPETASFDPGHLLDIAGDTTASAGVEVALDADIRLALGPAVDAVVRAGVSGTEYFDGNFDSLTAGLATGFTYAAGPFAASLMPHVYHQRLDGESYRTRYGVSAGVRGPIASRLEGELAVIAGYEDYADLDGRDATLLAVLPGIQAQATETVSLGLQYFAEARDSDDDRIATYRHGPVLSVYGRPRSWLEARARGSYLFAEEEASLGAADLKTIDLGLFWLPHATGFEALRVGLGYRWLERTSAAGLGTTQHRALLSLGTAW